VVQEVIGMHTTHAPRVVVGVDDSLSGLEALRFAVAEARRRGVGLRAIRAWQPTTPWHVPDAGQYRAAMVDAAAMVLHDAFQEAMGGLPKDLAVEALAVDGPTARVLVDQAGGEEDLLVIGRPGRGWRARLARAWRRLSGGSTVDVYCVRTAVCPVVTVGAPVLAVDGGNGLADDVVSAAEALLRDAVSHHKPDRPAQPA
jgi:nucleotide-binding universal stress UspA family protein